MAAKPPNMVRVSTYDLSAKSPRQKDERVIDSNKPDARNWLVKQVGWATRNGFGVQVEAADG